MKDIASLASFGQKFPETLVVSDAKERGGDL